MTFSKMNAILQTATTWGQALQFQGYDRSKKMSVYDKLEQLGIQLPISPKMTAKTGSFRF
jgi:hypothetical protein